MALSGFSLNLGAGHELQTRRIPGKVKPWLGVLIQGNTFIALAEFISDAEAEYLTKLLKSRAIVVAAEDENDE